MLFMSYASKNETIAYKVNEALEKGGIATWFAPKSIPSGGNYSIEIPKGVQASKAIVLLLSEAANISENVQRELALAMKYKKPIYAVRIENVEPSESLEYFLVTVQYKDLMDTLSLNAFVAFMQEKMGIVQRFESLVSEKNISLLCTQHFKQMTYKIYPSNHEITRDRPEVKRVFEAYPKNETFFDTCSTLLYAYNDATKASHFVVPLYREYATLPYLKGLEADLFWEYRFCLWTPKFLEEIEQKFSINTSEEMVDFKLKIDILKYYRELHWQEQDKRILIPILFYLFIKEPPVYAPSTYKIPLKSTYAHGEHLPHLLINYALLPQWWGTGKDDIDGIGTQKKYKGFLDSYEALMRSGDFLPQHADMAAYENYNGRLAETLCEIFLKKHQLIVQRHGVEHLLGHSLSLLGGKGVGENQEAITKITHFMSSPDFLVLKLNENKQIINAYYIDAKWRSFKDEHALKVALQKEGELFKHAQKYANNWDDVYLFLIAVFPLQKETKAYLLSVKEIIEGACELSSIKEDTVFPWIDALHVKEFMTWCNRIWL